MKTFMAVKENKYYPQTFLGKFFECSSVQLTKMIATI